MHGFSRFVKDRAESVAVGFVVGNAEAGMVVADRVASEDSMSGVVAAYTPCNAVAR